MPNITGLFSLGSVGVNSNVVGHCGGSGAFGTQTTQPGNNVVQQQASGASNTNRSWNFDASRSSSIYGKSTYVRVKNLTKKLWKRIC